MPISLSACATETSVVSGRTARASASGVTVPSCSTGTSVTVKPWCRSRYRQLSSTASCSIALVTTCRPRGEASAIPFTAVFAPSVPPVVRTTSPGRHPRNRAMVARASASPRAAASPTPCVEDGLPKTPVRYGHIASSTSRRTGVVAARSR